MFREKLILEELQSMSEILACAQPYINYEEKLLVRDIEKNKTSRKPIDNKPHEDGDKERNKGP